MDLQEPNLGWQIGEAQILRVAGKHYQLKTSTWHQSRYRLRICPSGLQPDKSRSSMEFFAKKVMPQLR